MENRSIYLLAHDESGECFGWLEASEDEIFTEEFVQRLRTLIG